MDSEVVARCRCGVETSILIGGGMSSFMNMLLPLPVRKLR